MKRLFNDSKIKWIASTVAIVAVLLITKNAWADYKLHHPDDLLATDQPQTSYLAQPMDTLPQTGEVIHIQKQTNDKSIKLSIENGVVTNLEIDGKKIDKKDYDQYQEIIDEASPKSSQQGNKSFFFFGDDPSGRMGLGGMNIFSDSISSMFNQDFFKGFQSIDMGDFDQMMAELNKHFEKLGFGGFQDSMKEFDGNNFNFSFPNHRNFHRDGGIWMDDLDTTESSTDMPKDANLSAILGNALNSDGILVPNKINKVELTGKYLKINGEKQPNNLYEKYRRILEDESGIVLNKNSKLKFDIEGIAPKRKYRSF